MNAQSDQQNKYINIYIYIKSPSFDWGFFCLGVNNLNRQLSVFLSD